MNVFLFFVFKQYLLGHNGRLPPMRFVVSILCLKFEKIYKQTIGCNNLNTLKHFEINSITLIHTI